MNMREMSLSDRVGLLTNLEAALGYAHSIEALISVKYFATPGTDDSEKALHEMTVRRESDLRFRLAAVLDAFDMAMVDKAVLEEGQKVCHEG